MGLLFLSFWLSRTVLEIMLQTWLTVVYNIAADFFMGRRDGQVEYRQTQEVCWGDEASPIERRSFGLLICANRT